MRAVPTSTTRLVAAILVVAALGAAFWILVLSPKREEAGKLAAEVTELQASLAEHRAEVAEALEAREEFPVDYRELVVLGKAVPGDDDTASLLIQLNRIAKRSEVRFGDFTLDEGGGSSAAPAPSAPAPEAGSTAQPISATEVAASTLPLGASIGPAGLAVMPYELTFNGNFFRIADFIKGLDSLVKTKNSNVAVNGRLITIDGFTLEPDPAGFPRLEATFLVTTFLTPPTQGVTGGASPVGPGPATATPASTTIGGTP
jgi:Tfp pilus assembly protein PilO